MKVHIRKLPSLKQRLKKSDSRIIENDLKKIHRILNVGHDDAELSVFFVDNAEMQRLNLKYRGVDRTTDVLSFPQDADLSDQRVVPLLLGDIVINIELAGQRSSAHGLTFKEEMRWLLIHGLLHLMGYEHEKGGADEKKMRDKERELLNFLCGRKGL